MLRFSFETQISCSILFGFFWNEYPVLLWLFWRAVFFWVQWKWYTHSWTATGYAFFLCLFLVSTFLKLCGWSNMAMENSLFVITSSTYIIFTYSNWRDFAESMLPKGHSGILWKEVLLLVGRHNHSARGKGLKKDVKWWLRIEILSTSLQRFGKFYMISASPNFCKREPRKASFWQRKDGNHPNTEKVTLDPTDKTFKLLGAHTPRLKRDWRIMGHAWGSCFDLHGIRC